MHHSSHSQPNSSEPSSSHPTVEALQRLYTVHCFKTYSYQKINDVHVTLCVTYYTKLIPEAVKQYYQETKRHQCVDGTKFYRNKCYACENHMGTIQPIAHCNPCINRYFEFTNEMEQLHRTINYYDDPIILAVIDD